MGGFKGKRVLFSVVMKVMKSWGKLKRMIRFMENEQSCCLA